jgi:hypothetical protein
MSKLKQIAAAVLLGAFATASLASEAYIDQAGSNTTINVTQTGTSNILSGDLNTTNPAIVSGDSIKLDIVQDGDYNEAAVKLKSATSAEVDYSATGRDNVFDVYIDGGSGNVVSTTVTGDDNRITVCGANTVGLSGASCSAGISANNVTNTIDVNGDLNNVNIAVASIAGTTNTVTIGGSVISNSNTVNITQTNTDVNIVDVSIDGNTNVVNIIQN